MAATTIFAGSKPAEQMAAGDCLVFFNSGRLLRVTEIHADGAVGFTTPYRADAGLFFEEVLPVDFVRSYLDAGDLLCFAGWEDANNARLIIKQEVEEQHAKLERETAAGVDGAADAYADFMDEMEIDGARWYDPAPIGTLHPWDRED